MKKRQIKKIYKLSLNIKNERNLKKQLKNIYNIEISMSELKNILLKIPDFYIKQLFTPKQKKFILYMYKNCINTKKLSTFLNEKYKIKMSVNNLRKFANDNNVKKIQKKPSSTLKISQNEVLNIIDLYEKGMTTYELAKMYEYKKHKSICDILRKNNIHIRNHLEIAQNKKTYSNFSLKTIDSKEKAYFIGLLITDGYVVGNMVGLDLTDKDAIEMLSKYINIKYRTIKSKNTKHKTKYRICLYGENLVKDCFRFGIFNKKTFTTNGCNLMDCEYKYLPYIFRGIIDGDGWIRKDGKEFFISSASNLFINWCKINLEKLGFLNLKIKYIKNSGNGIYLIRTGNLENIEILKNKIYDISFGMKRKYDRLYKEDVQRL